MDHDRRTLISVAAPVSRIGAHGKATIVARLGARAAVALPALDGAGVSRGGGEARVREGHPVEAINNIRARRGVGARGGQHEAEDGGDDEGDCGWEHRAALGGNDE